MLCMGQIDGIKFCTASIRHAMIPSNNLFESCRDILNSLSETNRDVCTLRVWQSLREFSVKCW